MRVEINLNSTWVLPENSLVSLEPAAFGLVLFTFGWQEFISVYLVFIMFCFRDFTILVISSWII